MVVLGNCDGKILANVLHRLKTLRQVAALPYIWTGAGVEVALVTSKERKSWIVPKGWPEKGITLSQTAALEAMEEAGIKGAVSQVPLGSYRYEKRLNKGYAVPCHVFVFALFVNEQQLDWKEKGQRRVRWFPIKEAARRTNNHSLTTLLTQIAATPAELPPWGPANSRNVYK